MSQSQWLVKSSGQILGPYSTKEIETCLLSQERTMQDEVAAPMGSWTLLRDQKDFSHIIKKLIDEDAALGDNTQILKSDSTEVTETLSSTSSSPSRSPLSTHPPPHHGKAPEAEYFYEGGAQRKDKFRIPLMIISFLIISTFGGILYLKVSLLSEKKLKQYRTLLVEGEKLIDQGRLDDALSKYTKAYQISSRNADFHIYLGALLARSGETVQASRILEDYLTVAPEMKEKVDLVMGIADLIDENYKEANKRLGKVSSPQWTLVVALNKSFSLMQTGEYTQAHELLQEASLLEVRPPTLLYLLLADVRIQLWNESLNPNHLIKSLNELKDYTESESKYYQESLLAQAYLFFLLDDKEQTTIRVMEALNVDPYQTSHFKGNIFIPHSIINTSFWRNWCPPLVNSTLSPIGSQILKSYCDFKDGNRRSALKGVKSVVEQKTTDPLGLSLYSFMLNELGYEEQAFVELNKALEVDSKNRLALSLKGYICDKRNTGCALETWSQLVELYSRSLAGYTGLVKHYLRNGETKKAMDIYTKGSSISNQYTPLLQLQEQLK